MTDTPHTGETPQEPDEASFLGLGKKRGRRLYSIKNVRCALADVIRAYEAGEIGGEKARNMGYLLKSLADVMKGSDLEERIAVLEGRRS